MSFAVDGRIELSQGSQRRPVCRGRAARQQPGGRVYQGAGADAGQQRDGGALAADPVKLSVIAQVRAGAAAARVDQHVQRRRVGVAMLGLDDQPFGTPHQPAGPGQAANRASVLGEPPGPVGQHLPGADGVEFFDLVEQHDADILQVCGHAAIQPRPHRRGTAGGQLSGVHSSSPWTATSPGTGPPGGPLPRPPQSRSKRGPADPATP